MTTTTDRLLTTEEAAEFLRVSPTTMVSWRRNHTGPAFVSPGGKKKLYRESEILAYVASRTVNPASEARS
ncbi:MAG: helix-turn-helix domain-containing protein [Candidatus Competibacter denitrificans]